MIGPKLGRPRKDVAGERNEVESKFGITKRRYGLALIMCKLQETSETEIMMQFMVMNAAHRIRVADKLKRQQTETVQKPSIWQFTTSISKIQFKLCPAYQFSSVSRAKFELDF